MMASRLLLLFVLSGLLFAGAIVTFGASISGTASASTGQGCAPVPGSFSIPEGHRAHHFRITAARPGTPCSPEVGTATEGFSIRRGGATVYIFYREQGGRTISDPVPLSDLALASGEYTLLAAPGQGAEVTLAWEVAAE